jgi:hypothetical protein
MNRSLLSALCTALMLAVIGACGSDDVSTPEPIAAIDIVALASPIPAGEPVTLTVIARDAGGDQLDGRAFTFSSSDDKIAKVTSDGVVTGSVPGTATITVTAEGKHGSTQVTVVLGPPATIVVLPSTVALYPATSTTLSTLSATKREISFQIRSSTGLARAQR